MNNYGYSKTNPDYWLLIANAILNDGSLTRDDKFKAQKELIEEYYKEKRDDSARKTARKGVGHIGPKSLEQMSQEIFSLKNTKKLFMTSKKKARLAKLLIDYENLANKPWKKEDWRNLFK